MSSVLIFYFSVIVRGISLNSNTSEYQIGVGVNKLCKLSVFLTKILSTPERSFFRLVGSAPGKCDMAKQHRICRTEHLLLQRGRGSTHADPLMQQSRFCLVTFVSRYEGRKAVTICVYTQLSTKCDFSCFLSAFVLPGQEKNCSHEVTVVLFSRTFYEAKSIGMQILCFHVSIFKPISSLESWSQADRDFFSFVNCHVHSIQVFIYHRILYQAQQVHSHCYEGTPVKTLHRRVLQISLIILKLSYWFKSSFLLYWRSDISPSILVFSLLAGGFFGFLVVYFYWK